ncbi:MAG: mRNA degradation ribonuclease J1/J2 [Candidatus Methanohalarchaeum thermophilum]|uniref:mRNA degradation ribonuclease J1/J2 n=1 Tax=Methanohalarchaeum thermophilum TaxID=1903181 RepID=A0A1Q6DVE1_METT1|nr:MAG: mRNA degradation ribonuclease J1/J2 [Candidatus Methanohalarchaeum thermophilum]
MGMPQYKAHASGHVDPNQLKNAIEEINFNKVVPVHTESQRQFERFISDFEYRCKATIELKN